MKRGKRRIFSARMTSGRVLLVMLGILLIALAMAALLYAVQPVLTSQLSTPVAPTYFLPPGGKP